LHHTAAKKPVLPTDSSVFYCEKNRLMNKAKQQGCYTSDKVTGGGGVESCAGRPFHAALVNGMQN
jgi:hypothetical protein